MFFPFGLNRFLFSPFYIMFVQKYIKEITYANFVNYPNILPKIYFYFFLAGLKRYAYICGEEKEVSMKLFSTEQLRSLGFTQEREAGFTYLWLETTRGVKLATPDYEDTGMDIADDEFHRIYIFGEDNQLTLKQIEILVAGEEL